MASLVLGTLGNALGPVGGIVGGIVGGLIDSMILGRSQDPIEGPRLSDLKVANFDEGSPVPFVMGAVNRVPGQIIWMSELKEIEVRSGGGKGGASSSPVVIQYEYLVDVAVAFARQETAEFPIPKIWANGTLIYEQLGALDITSTVVSVSPYAIALSSGLCYGKPGEERIRYLHSGAGYSGNDYFFKDVVVGEPITISGCANARNNGTWIVVSKEPPSTLQSIFNPNASRITIRRCSHTWAQGYYWYQGCTDSSSCLAGVTEAAGSSIRFQQDVQTFNAYQVESVTTYNGASDQTPDPIIAAAVDEDGDDLVPAFRGTTYVVLKNLNVTKWGSTVPSFEALLDSGDGGTVGDAIAALLELNGSFNPDQYDVSSISGPLRGAVMMGIRPPLEMLQALMMVFDIDVQHRSVVDGSDIVARLIFFHKEDADVRTVADDDRGARQADSRDEEDVISITKNDDDPQPSDMNIQFLDPDQDLEPKSSNFRRNDATIYNQARVSLPITLTADEAYDLARKLMWQQMLSQGVEVRVSLPPTYIDVIEGDTLVVNDLAGRPLSCRVVGVDRGANGIIKAECVLDHAALYE